VQRKTAEMRMTGLDDLVTVEEVVAAVSEASDCRIDEVTASELRRAPRSFTSACLRYPFRVKFRGSSAFEQVGRRECRPG
jgi:hypothetical protein